MLVGLAFTGQSQAQIFFSEYAEGTAGNNKYIVQLNVVDKIHAIPHTELSKTKNRILVLDNQQIPYSYLREEFNQNSTPPPEIEQVIVIKFEDQRAGIVVDSVLGEYQAVIKPLGKFYKNQEFISGATILGDGTISLVLDTNKIIKEVSNKK